MSAQPANVSAETRLGLTVRPHTPADDAAWDRYAESHAGYTLYHGRAFHRAVAEAFGKPSHGLVAENGAGRIVGVLPLIRQKSWLFGDRLVSLPYANHGGPLVDAPGVALALFEAAIVEAGRLGGPRLEVRDHHERDIEWPVHIEKVLVTRRLPNDPGALGRELGAKLRSQCRRALKEGAEVVHGGAELIPEFYRVFAVNMRDLGTPVYPRRWFEVLARCLGDAMQLVVVRLEGRSVAGCVLMRWGETLEIPWAASLREYNRYSVNMLLYRAALDHAIGQGCREFDFGRSTRDSGPHRFKLQWGGEERAIWWRTWPARETNGQAGAFMRRSWQRLPLGLTTRLGPMISPALPW